MSHSKIDWRFCLKASLFFGGAQGFFFGAGFFFGFLIDSVVSKAGPPLAFILLVFIGAKLIWEAIRKWRKPRECRIISCRLLIMLSIATSIDALAVGITFPLLSDRAGIGWTTFEHTGHDVPMYSFGLIRPPKTIDNTDIARVCAQAMGFDLGALNERLIVDASKLFADAAIIIDTAGVEASKGMLLVDNGKTHAIFPFFKNMMIIDQDTLILEGLTLYSKKINKVFVPRQARALFNKQ